MKTQQLIIIGVAAIAVIAVGSYLALSNAPESDDIKGSIGVEFKYNPDIRYAIFGNSNGDDYLNNDDLVLLKKLIDGSIAYESKKHSFADTNADGILDAEDVTLLKKLLAKEKCKLYYWSAAAKVDSVDYPLTGNIGTHHMYPIDALIILGLYDRVVGTSNQTFQNSIAVDGLRYPGMGTKIANVGSPWENCEAAVAAKINIWIQGGAQAAKNYTTYKQVADAAGLNLQIIRLNITSYNSDSSDQYGVLLMLGTMFQCEQKAYEFIKWADGVSDTISKAVKGLNKEWTFLTPMGTKSPGNIKLDTSYTNGSMFGDVYTIGLTGMKSVNTVVESGCPPISLEEIYNLNPNVIVIIMFQTSDKTVAKIQEEFNEYAEIYKNTNAYKNKNVYGVNYYNIATYSGLSELVLLSSYIWPSLFTEESGWNYLNYYYKHYTMYNNPDISNMGNAIPFRMAK